MARPTGARKVKTLEEKISENEIKIKETEELLKSLKEEKKILTDKKEQEDLQSLMKTIITNGITIEAAQKLIETSVVTKTPKEDKTKTA